MARIGDAYLPDIGTFCDILKDYTAQGLKFFKEQEAATQQRMRTTLKGGLEDNEDEITYKLSRIKKGHSVSFRFLPMPRPRGTDFRASFFVPRIERLPDARYTCSFTILFWIERDLGKTVALRLEPSGGIGNAHAYTHMQLTRTIGDFTTSFEQWIPQSYPAIPLGYNHPVQLFIGMAVAVHGYSGNDKKEYVRAAIADMAPNSPARAKKILDEVKRLLDV